MVKFLKRVFKFFMSRGFIISFLLLLQVLLIFAVAWQIGQFGIYIFIAFNILSYIFAFSIINRSFNPAYKLSWLMVVFMLPFAGVFFYMMFGRLRLSRRRIRKMNELYNQLASELKRHERDVKIDDDEFEKMSNYVTNVTGMQVYDNTISTYLSPGEKMYQTMLSELEKAKKFIFLEYFIIGEGEMWQSIFSILKEKVKQGIDVRLIYDDFGCINRINNHFKKQLKAAGIKFVNFNPFRPRLSMVINYRDHRKITVIDGEVGFVGGINLADEYINRIHLFGYWKDSSIMIKGDAVWNLTFLFLQMWQISTKDTFNYDNYRPSISYSTNGYVQPFGDGPLDSHQIIEMAYLQMINNAKKYIYITSPYLILDNEIISALRISAISGVDVRIILPHHPDKKIVFAISKSYYKILISSGVKIYEYLPGFMHAKVAISDDEIAMIGTANLDYRSLYLHYEVSCMLYKTTSINEIKDDIEKVISVSHQVSFEECKKAKWYKKLIVAFLKAFAPMI